MPRQTFLRRPPLTSIMSVALPPIVPMQLTAAVDALQALPPPPPLQASTARDAASTHAARRRARGVMHTYDLYMPRTSRSGAIVTQYRTLTPRKSTAALEASLTSSSVGGVLPPPAPVLPPLLTPAARASESMSRGGGTAASSELIAGSHHRTPRCPPSCAAVAAAAPANLRLIVHELCRVVDDEGTTGPAGFCQALEEFDVPFKEGHAFFMCLHHERGRATLATIIAAFATLTTGSGGRATAAACFAAVAQGPSHKIEKSALDAFHSRRSLPGGLTTTMVMSMDRVTRTRERLAGDGRQFVSLDEFEDVFISETEELAPFVVAAFAPYIIQRHSLLPRMPPRQRER
jgi:hypothetical protein